jgi:hypothetical protein
MARDNAMTDDESSENDLPWPRWELDMILDVADRWNINATQAENFLVSVGAFKTGDGR